MSFAASEIVPAVEQLNAPVRLEEFRRNVAGLENRAVFEVPEILGRLMGAGW